MLPFPVVAIEDPAGLVILADVEENKIGLNNKRFFIECISSSTNTDNFDSKNMNMSKEEINKLNSRIERWNSDFNNTYFISVGTINEFNVDMDHKIGVRGEIQNLFICSEKSLIEKVDLHRMDRLDHRLKEGPLTNVSVALQELIYFNKPKSFILEETPLKINEKQMKKNLKIPRSHQRPKYTLLEANDIRRKMGLNSVDDKQTKIPHERRGHIRTFKNDVFKNKKGQSIWVKSTWVGPSESVVKNKRYKVMLNI